LPRRHGGAESELITLEEYRDKLRAALAGRSDRELCVVGRTGALARAGMEEALRRVEACAETGVDAIFVVGVSDLEQVRRLRSATSLPFLLNSLSVPAEELLREGVRIVMQGHQPYFYMLRALYDAYLHLLAGGTPAELQKQALPPDLQKIALAEQDYQAWVQAYLTGGQ
jgi:2-methylisocitrate lyase-like PEP mutase family enzyme